MKETRYRLDCDFSIGDLLRLSTLCKVSFENGTFNAPTKTLLNRIHRETEKAWREYRLWRKQNFKCAGRIDV